MTPPATKLNPLPTEEWVDTEKAAELTRRNRKTIQRWCRLGIIQCRNNGLRERQVRVLNGFVVFLPQGR